jgi:hypothetical protein
MLISQRDFALESLTHPLADNLASGEAEPPFIGGDVGEIGKPYLAGAARH